MRKSSGPVNHYTKLIYYASSDSPVFFISSFFEIGLLNRNMKLTDLLHSCFEELSSFKQEDKSSFLTLMKTFKGKQL